jgi:hypothetical protein
MLRNRRGRLMRTEGTSRFGFERVDRFEVRGPYFACNGERKWGT